MHAVRLAAALGAFLVVAGCRSAQSPAPATTGGGAAAQPAAATTATAGGTTSAAPANAARRRSDPRQLEASRANVVAQLLTRIAGREQEPAGTVFKNVQLLKDMPAGDFLRMMNVQYGRSLNVACSSCHVPGEWEKDDKKNKVVARDMQRMTTHINTQQLAKIPQLDADYEKVNCGTCHKASMHPAGTLPHPDSAATAPAAAAPPGR